MQLTIWEPDDRAFWEREGERIARRNLALSVPPLVLAFAVWSLWSVVVVYLPFAGFRFSTAELFWLAALPALCGATLRIFYAFMVPVFGGRRWTVISTVSLLAPTIGLGWAVQDTGTSYATFAMLALLCGLGGGNFASSMSNISYFFPHSHKGIALGLNAGLGNLGVSLAQFVVPLVVTAGVFGVIAGDPQGWTRPGDGPGGTHQLWLQNAGYLWAPLIVIAAVAAWYGMDDLTRVKATVGEQARAFRRGHAWILCWLYLGTFGSFIGYSAGLPLLITTQFASMHALNYAWLGPLVGALVRPVGGWMADQLGGARVLLWTFIVMAAASGGAWYFLPGEGYGGNFLGFLGMFMLLFLAAGIGNGATFRMIPAVFAIVHAGAAGHEKPGDEEKSSRLASAEAAAVLGLASAVGAYGGFFIPLGYGASLEATGSASAALGTFTLFYFTCVATTWWFYARKGARTPC